MLHPRWVKDPRSWGLLFGASVMLSRALAYAPWARQESLPVGLAEVSRIVPVWAYGLLWAATAIGLTVIAAQQTPARARHAWLVGTPILWGTLYAIGAVLESNARAVSAAYLFGSLAGMLGALILVRPGERRAR